MPLRRAFTLIEMLVAIAIVVILCAILFPVFSRAKASARQTTCMSNLGQIGAAIGIYLQDYDETFPSAVDPIDRIRPEIWDAFPEFQARIPSMPYLHEALQTYIRNKDVFCCPSDTGTAVVDDQWWIDFPTAPSMFKTYGTSYFFRTEIAFRQWTSMTFRLPASTNVLFDAAGHWHGNGPMMKRDTRDRREVLRGYRYNVLFGDLHTESMTFDQLEESWNTPLE